MADVTSGLIVEILRSVQRDIAVMKEDLADLKSDFRGIKAHVHGFGQTEMAQDGQIASLQRRVERIEHRLDLYEPTSG